MALTQETFAEIQAIVGEKVAEQVIEEAELKNTKRVKRIENSQGVIEMGRDTSSSGTSTDREIAAIAGNSGWQVYMDKSDPGDPPCNTDTGSG